ncbi:hypothetical protein AB0F52_19150 [Amycolatopsis sp. NPDC024027]|uniref:hypothetical protein n=1 Tax=Amycolatopsis sp. NPDC024027 TaxID=3154327 RepID=UPI0033BFFC22
MSGNVISPALLAVAAGAGLAFGTFGVLASFGPSERTEAVVETRHNEQPPQGERLYELVFRTPSGEHFKVREPDAHLDLEPGLPVGLQVSAVGRKVQAVETGDHRVSTDSLGAVAWLAVVFGAGMLLGALVSAADTGRPGLATLSATSGLVVGALPVLLLF